MKRNGKIELLRFIFSIGVLCYHVQKYLATEIKPTSNLSDIRFDFFVHGAMGVEFFFIVSGFLMASAVFNSMERDKDLPLGKSTALFMKKKFMGIFPMHCIVAIPVFIATALSRNWTTTSCVTKIADSVPGFFFLQMAGFKGTYINHIEWYLSAMMICMFLIYPFLKKFYTTFTHIIAPLATILILGYMAQNYGKLTGVLSWEGLCYRGMLRGICELCLGTVCFEVSRYIKAMDMTKGKKALFTLSEIGLWGITFVLVMTTVPYYFEIYTLLAIAAATTISFSDVSFGGKIFNNKFFCYLGKLSLPIYLSQLILIELVPAYLNHLDLGVQMIIAIAGTLVISIGLMHLTDLITSHKKRKA